MTKRYRVRRWCHYSKNNYTNYYFQSLRGATNFMKDIYKHIHERVSKENEGFPHDHMEDLPTIKGKGLNMTITTHHGGYNLTEVKD